MRSFTNDLRATRQLSISTGRQAMLTYATGANARSYVIYIGDKPFNSATWSLRPRTPGNIGGTHQLESIDYFPAYSGSPPQTFADVLDGSAGSSCTAGTDNSIDIIFFPDGHVQLPAGTTSATITLKTDRSIPRSQYAITVSPSGRVLAQ